MNQEFALLSLVFMMAFVFQFDAIHQRDRNYQRIRSMYDAVRAGAAAQDPAA
jgi:hypothetical protein